MSSSQDGLSKDMHPIRRRDFLNIAACGVTGVGICGAAVPLIAQMNPSKDIVAQAKTEVDITAVQPGQTLKVVWRGQPVFIRHLTKQEITEANAVSLSDLRDPETLSQRTKPGKSNWLVTMALCTHLGCIPLGGNVGEPRGEYGGYFCPCHGSAFDTAGRIRRGPAPTNLVVPPYAFISNSVISIG
ncbi:MAG: ubiquinol-cytochrome c reductase iron-sulfur subunit [Zymomonas mobilis subsp. pomaceae]|uniref:Ubiquinol-cytochrome c reductase iron-sulfur subunit n=1 Tax=Zymomonas mobilis subsp. pomaceae (strain ATCC 29192 / DSM 22645 / JCM 10191 / CCUG 17912 / NBRC 13757 / NCIMB 11200 / NRRL B-4491 / Barker I) TaxID=579138 RepID=F8EUK4_ZYMMT|nr:ubiquinol-cytochrome c reductase iron-sulfur subunit [Zymomonas mobilis]AEI37220.1 ubiquinol-cytochrome c reductase, iron-sulfur subunit [Zymomonas mobilis subsp. pomaceae ATCC 29192]MDX5948590.1 ubiquinol-cytochrome c reductase iron-sulfur subunit [Zymomonas mobilis subsp. pomaceae]GEB88396.1 ubiquinol-cytochrome c reductase iron-sulfur subunit [Zymomonas mobilis subsp. pomaceae]